MQEKIHVTDTERVKKPTQNQNTSKVSKKHTILWKLQTQCILFHIKLLPTYSVHKINGNTYDKAYPKMTNSFNAKSHRVHSVT